MQKRNLNESDLKPPLKTGTTVCNDSPPYTRRMIKTSTAARMDR